MYMYTVVCVYSQKKRDRETMFCKQLMINRLYNQKEEFFTLVGFYL